MIIPSGDRPTSEALSLRARTGRGPTRFAYLGDVAPLWACAEIRAERSAGARGLGSQAEQGESAALAGGWES
jgi:hypothetical protein